MHTKTYTSKYIPTFLPSIFGPNFHVPPRDTYWIRFRHPIPGYDVLDTISIIVVISTFDAKTTPLLSINIRNV